MSKTGLVRAEYRFLLNGSQLEFHADFTTADPINVPYLETISGGLANWCAADLMPHLSHELVFVELFLKSLDPAQPAEFTSTDGMPVVGGDSTPAEANQVAMVISLLTDEVSPTGRGRMFLGGIGRTQVTAGLYTSLITGFVNTAIVALAGLLDGSPLQWVVYSTKDDVARAVVGWAVRNIPAGLNRRRIGRGF